MGSTSFYVCSYSVQSLRSNEEFKKKVSRILEDEAQEKEDLDSQLDVQAEESIYSGGFASDGDRNTMQEFIKQIGKTDYLLLTNLRTLGLIILLND